MERGIENIKAKLYGIFGRQQILIRINSARKGSAEAVHILQSIEEKV